MTGPDELSPEDAETMWDLSSALAEEKVPEIEGMTKAAKKAIAKKLDEK